MALKYGIFPGVKIGTTDDGLPISDRAVDDAYFARYHSMFLSNGVYGKFSSCGQVLAGSGMGLIVQPIDVFINGWYAYDLEPETLTLSAASESRTDIVVAQLNIPDRLIKIYVKSGTTNLTRTNDIWELCLAQVAISKGQTVVAQSAIRDTRLNSNLCGIVTGLIKQIDPSTLLAQMESWFTNKKAADEADYQHWYDTFTTGKQSEFDTWFAGVKDTLSGDAAGNLLGKINETNKNLQDQINNTAGNLQNKINETDKNLQNQISALDSKKLDKSALLNIIFKPGTVYTSRNSTSPASLFGGTWRQIKDRFILAAGDNYKTWGKGGEAYHQLVRNELPNISLGPNSGNGFIALSYSDRGEGAVVSGGSPYYYITKTSTTESLGIGRAFNIMPPYDTFYMWERIS